MLAREWIPRLAWTVALALAAAPGPADACAVCFGDPASPTTRAAKLAVLTMIGVVAGVLAVIARTALVWNRRAWERESRSCRASVPGRRAESGA
jgi:hypothetical protein